LSPPNVVLLNIGVSKRIAERAASSRVLRAQTAKPPAHTETGGFAFPHTMLWGGNVWGSRTGVQAKRPDPTKKIICAAWSSSSGVFVAVELKQ
jgi:hypothetical protein